MSNDEDTPDVRSLTYRNLIELVNRCVQFELIAQNVDRPDAAKYGTHPDGSPRYGPEWYIAQGTKTGIHEELWGVLTDTLRCLSLDGEGRWCIGAMGHTHCHYDGNGANW